MITLLLILIIIACVLLIFIILAQNPKGGGLSGTFGNTASQFLGARQSADFMEKATWYFGIGIFVIVVITYFLTATPGGDGMGRSKVEDANFTPPPVSAPGGNFGTQQQQQQQQQQQPTGEPQPQPQPQPQPLLD